ncbi:putative ob-fold nucleic acid binding domain [Diplodia seriata]|uniref:Putative ob-fold nucleic acid binding domain n=1 Tax=Diplodia seriata TaxID=420778 RepID=A0A0G2DXK3_9PEZI|nr:putative ob-fold nucleic acid binding domain [Diplodia seriata]
MTTSAGAKALQFYPERYYSASPTYNTWVKLTAAAVHRLRPAPSQAEPAISRTDSFDRAIHPTFFHLNHPIRFVRLVGTVVAVEDLGPRFALLTLDDGSGATLELKITRLTSGNNAAAAAAPGNSNSNSAPGTTTPTTTSNTTVPNLTVHTAIGLFSVLTTNNTPINIGTTLKAKCTLGTFRNTIQGVLQRCWVLGSTSSSTRAEAEAWRDTAAFMRSVLARPWVLDGEERRRLDGRMAKEERRRREEEGRAERKRVERARRKEEFLRERGERRRVYEEKVELRRRKEEVLMNKGALV